MRIDPEECVSCGNCIPVCPVGAIKLREESAVIVRDKCVECGVCYRSGFCPTDSFIQENLSWPRAIRYVFSDPLASHESTKIPGRGTAEMKTNDITNRFTFGEVGIGIEVGRPGIATRLSEVEKLTIALSTLEGMEIIYEPENPVTEFIDENTGRFKDRDILKERVLSAIIEFKVKEESAGNVLEMLKDRFNELDTVASLELITRELGGNGPTDKIRELIAKKGFSIRPNGKTNLGLGRKVS